MGPDIGDIDAVGVIGYRTYRADKQVVDASKVATSVLFKDLPKLFCAASIADSRRGKGRSKVLLVNVFRIFSKQNMRGHKCRVNYLRSLGYVEQG